MEGLCQIVLEYILIRKQPISAFRSYFSVVTVSEHQANFASVNSDPFHRYKN
jgi:hypothetical protein